MSKSFRSYRNPALAVDLVIFGYTEETLSVLLLNRKEAPFAGRWTLPGAFVQMDETLVQTAARILDIKLGISKVFLEQLYTFDDPARDERGRVIAVAHYALINPGKVQVVAGQMANDVKWFPVTKLPALGFDHRQIFRLALQRLQSKMLYHPVGFELLDELFTLPELHRLYEVVLGVEIDRRNFSRRITESGFVINSGLQRTGVKNRRPDLYRFNKQLKQNSFYLNISLHEH